MHLVVEEACSDLDAVVAHGSAASAHKSLKNQTKRPHARVRAVATVTPVKHDINGNLKQKKQRNKLAACSEKITLEGVMYSVSTFVHFLQWCSELARVLGMTVKALCKFAIMLHCVACVAVLAHGESGIHSIANISAALKKLRGKVAAGDADAKRLLDDCTKKLENAVSIDPGEKDCFAMSDGRVLCTSVLNGRKFTPKTKVFVSGSDQRACAVITASASVTQAVCVHVLHVPVQERVMRTPQQEVSSTKTLLRLKRSYRKLRCGRPCRCQQLLGRRYWRSTLRGGYCYLLLRVLTLMRASDSGAGLMGYETSYFCFSDNSVRE